MPRKSAPKTKGNGREKKKRLREEAESASDSDGEPADIGGDDESIDDDGSDVGWNSEDEQAFGTIFDKNKPDDSGEDESDDEGDGEEGGMLLSDFLDKNLKTSGKSSVKHTSHDEDAEEESDGSGLSGSEGDSLSDEEDDSDLDDDDDDEDHSRLLSAIEKYSKAAGVSSSSFDGHGHIVQSAKESAYSSLLDPSSSSSAVSMDALLDALEDSGGLKAVKQRLSTLEKASSAPKYVHKAHSDRMERDITYKGTSEEMGKWQKTVQDNKHARSLDLAGDRRLLPSYKNLVNTYEPSNDMEREVQMVLISSGQNDERAAEESENQMLTGKGLSAEELKARHSALAKVKALLFYEQRKRNRINKIKSKTYHRILKRRRKRLEATEGGDEDEDDEELRRELGLTGAIGEDMDEDEVTKRIKERMDLRHKNTGKWARMASKHGKVNKSLRDAYHESVLLGNELTKKASDTGRSKEGDESDDGSDDDHMRISDKVGGELGDALGDGDGAVTVDGKYKALFSMDFMQKAREQQQARAREEAKNILRVIESMEDEQGMSGGSDSEDEAVSAAQQAKEKEKAEKLAAARQEMNALMKGGGKSMALRDKAKNPPTEKAANDSVSTVDNPWLGVGAGGNGRSVDKLTGNKTSGKKGGVVKAAAVSGKSSGSRLVGDTLDMSHVWNEGKEASTTTAPAGQKKKKNKKKKNKKSDDGENKVQGEGAGGDKNKTQQAKGSATSTQQDRKPLLAQKSQDDLVQQAFAGPDLEAEFLEMKDRAIDDELNISDKKRKIMTEDKAGWGDWAGPGLMGVSEKVVQKRRRLLQNLDEKKSELRAGRKDGVLANILLSEKRIKTAAKYKIADIPHPFRTREEYERSLQMPLGDEWNAAQVVRKNTKPVIMMRAGRVIAPIKLPKKQQPRKGL